MALRANDFNYSLPSERIAHAPAARRDRSRLMVLDRSTGLVSHRRFFELPELLESGDLLVLNDTRVVPAKFFCRRRTGGKIEGLFLLASEPGRWEVMLKNAGRCRPGEQLRLVGGPKASLLLEASLGQGRWRAQTVPALGAEQILDQAGSTPLPPYIHRPGGQDSPADRARYQTVYASRAGAVAAPTAGLHLTKSLLGKLAAAGVQTAYLTLHVGLGTFLPVKSEDLAAHEMHAEWYDLPADVAEKLNAARQAGRRIVAVGTTSVRVLETVASTNRRFAAATGWTDIFLYPPGRFRAVDAMITNFHLPKSTLLMLVAAFCSPGRTDGLEMVLSAYREAIERGYRFYSYGDAMLIL